MAAITTAAIGVATTVYATNAAKKEGKKNRDAAANAAKGADPYAEYRAGAAADLDALQADPSKIKNTAEYKARMMAAERTMASQGYTGSGNAMVAAAEAGASVYQQAFDNLARQSGVDVGLQTAAGVSSTGLQTAQNSSDNYLSSIGGVANNIGNLAGTIGARFNQPAAVPTGGTARTSVGTGPA